MPCRDYCDPEPEVERDEEKGELGREEEFNRKRRLMTQAIAKLTKEELDALGVPDIIRN